MNTYHLLDIFFMVFHSCVILFNTLGWIWKKTRIYNLILLLITAGSWFLLGIWKGWGYCFLTDWHYDVLLKLGYHDLPGSYIRFLIERVTGIDISEGLVNAATLFVFFASLIISAVLNYRDLRHK